MLGTWAVDKVLPTALDFNGLKFGGKKIEIFPFLSILIMICSR